LTQPTNLSNPKSRKQPKTQRTNLREEKTENTTYTCESFKDCSVPLSFGGGS